MPPHDRQEAEQEHHGHEDIEDPGVRQVEEAEGAALRRRLEAVFLGKIHATLLNRQWPGLDRAFQAGR